MWKCIKTNEKLWTCSLGISSSVFALCTSARPSSTSASPHSCLGISGSSLASLEPCTVSGIFRLAASSISFKGVAEDRSEEPLPVWVDCRRLVTHLLILNSNKYYNDVPVTNRYVWKLHQNPFTFTICRGPYQFKRFRIILFLLTWDNYLKRRSTGPNTFRHTVRNPRKHNPSPIHQG